MLPVAEEMTFELAEPAGAVVSGEWSLAESVNDAPSSQSGAKLAATLVNSTAPVKTAIYGVATARRRTGSIVPAGAEPVTQENELPVDPSELATVGIPQPLGERIDPSELATVGIPQPLPPARPVLPVVPRGPSTHEALLAVRTNRRWFVVAGLALTAVILAATLINRQSAPVEQPRLISLSSPPLLEAATGDEFTPHLMPPPLPQRAYVEPEARRPQPKPKPKPASDPDLLEVWQ